MKVEDRRREIDIAELAYRIREIGRAYHSIIMAIEELRICREWVEESMCANELKKLDVKIEGLNDLGDILYNKEMNLRKSMR